MPHLCSLKSLVGAQRQQCCLAPPEESAQGLRKLPCSDNCGEPQRKYTAQGKKRSKATAPWSTSNTEAGCARDCRERQVTEQESKVSGEKGGDSLKVNCQELICCCSLCSSMLGLVLRDHLDQSLQDACSISEYL